MARRVGASRAQTHSRSIARRRWLSSNSRAALSRRAGRIRLFPAVTVALLAGLAVAFAAYGFLRWITPVDPTRQAAEIDVTRVALTVVAGVGGVVALVIAYRRQRDLEQGRFVERFGAAAAQLGATDVAVRIAGVYAMAGVADESDGLRRQQCIDVLCGYLRLPYDPELGANHQSKLVLKRHRATADNTRADDQERHLEYRHNDREVRATIVRVIADHLRPSAEYSWSTSDFDFRTAYLEDVDFTEVTVWGSVRFGNASFSGGARFAEAKFFHAEFNGATFSGGARFDKTTFMEDVEFNGATFSKVAWFDGATFSRTTGFQDVKFARDATFDKARFDGLAEFDSAMFAGSARFGDVVFSNGATFWDAEFSGDARFVDTRFDGDVGFDSATFAGAARFSGAVFGNDASFVRVTFSDAASFARARFVGDADFDEVTFSSAARFELVDFGRGKISFAEPKQWGPPTPRFDWDQDISQKPENIRPHPWPPEVAEAS